MPGPARRSPGARRIYSGRGTPAGILRPHSPDPLPAVVPVTGSGLRLPSVFRAGESRGEGCQRSCKMSIPIAEYVMRAVLDEFQQAEVWRRQASERSWTIHDWREVAGSTWLIVGLGGIGTEVAVRARAFGARVIGCRRNPTADDPTDLTVTPDRLHEVVSGGRCDRVGGPRYPATTDLWSHSSLA